MNNINGISMKSINGMIANKKWDEVNKTEINISLAKQIYINILNTSLQKNSFSNQINNWSSYKGIIYTSRKNSDIVDMKLKGEERCWFFYDQEGNFYIRFFDQENKRFLTRKYDMEAKVYELIDKTEEKDKQKTEIIDERIKKCKRYIDEMMNAKKLTKEIER